MNQFIKVIPLLAGLVFISGCKQVVLRSSQVSSTVKIDGMVSEWNVNDFSSIKDNIAKLGYTQDGNFIYIAGVTTNKDIIRQAAFGGLILYIDPSGEENKDLQMDVKLPQSKRIEYYKGGFFAALSDDQKKTVLQRIDSLKQGVTVTEVKEDISMNFFEGTNNTFAGKMYLSRDTLMFEVKIPVRINELFPSKQQLSGRSVFGISSSMSMPGYADRPGPFSTTGGDGMQGNRRRLDEEERQPDRLDVWFKLGGGSDE